MTDKTKRFLQKLKDKGHWNDDYDYSKVNYIGSHTKVIVIDKKYGTEHLINPSRMLFSVTKCNIKNAVDKTVYLIEVFREVHGDKYDYSKINYIKNKTKVTIICPEHGEFEQTPSDHKRGGGCPTCGDIKLTTEEVIEQFREVHGNTYDYSNVNYINTKTKVTIICPEHGEFEQTPSNHKRCRGCPTCNGRTKLTTEEVIEQFREVHGDKYDYSQVNYINTKTKVTIICPEHGEFEQLPNSHKQGKGCPTCNGRTKLTTEEFIEKAKIIHDDKYDYSNVNYINAKTKVTIICDDHGEFEQTPSDHKKGFGCPTCGDTKLTTEEIIEQFREVHGNTYDYSNVNYINTKTKVTIICDDHGEFEQTPSNHKRGVGCPTCGNRPKLTAEEIIELFREVHGDKYDYSQVNYINTKTKVTIICDDHGEFEQTPNNHKRGAGCPSCKESKGEREIRTLLIDKDIDFNQEHTFDDCKNILPLRFDFYLPEHNVCIEYQGSQHYEPVDFFGGVSGFEYRQYLDKIKEGYCIDNNIQLLKIRYDEDVFNVLNEYLNSKCTINLQH